MEFFSPKDASNSSCVACMTLNISVIIRHLKYGGFCIKCKVTYQIREELRILRREFLSYAKFAVVKDFCKFCLQILLEHFCLCIE
jgi:hypothetical protein